MKVNSVIVKTQAKDQRDGAILKMNGMPVTMGHFSPLSIFMMQGCRSCLVLEN